jgi:thioredoxin-like negative regulator of GroEL
MRSTGIADQSIAHGAGTPIWRPDTTAQPLMPVSNADEFERQTLTEPGDYVALFGARWCAPAYRLADRLAEIADRHPITGLWIDVDALPVLAKRYQVTALPAMVLLRNGQVIAHRIGDLDTDVLEDWIAGAGPT